jgi:hypothetical protein
MVATERDLCKLCSFTSGYERDENPAEAKIFAMEFIDRNRSLRTYENEKTAKVSGRNL